MSNSSSEPPEKWQRVLAAAKASQRVDDTPGERANDTPQPPQEFSSNLLGKVRAFHASLAAWQRWSLLAGLISIILFIASIIYLKSTSPKTNSPIIETPGLELPQPSSQSNQSP